MIRIRLTALATPSVGLGVGLGVALAIALATLAACTTDDWGRCLASHEESRQTEPVLQPDGTLMPSGEYETVTVCDRWEYPNGVRP